MHVIPCNYGPESVALIQWMHQHGLTNVHCVRVDTGWAAPGWQDRVSALEDWVRSLGFAAVTLKPKRDFVGLMEEQKKFPTQKFQWCASFLKGLPMLEYLDFDLDPELSATVVLPLRRSAARSLMNLTEKVERSEHYNGRPLWHPLLNHTEAEIDALVFASGVLERLDLRLRFPHTRRSLECHPCVNSSASEVNACRHDSALGPRLQALEAMLSDAFPSTPDAATTHAASSLEGFLRGCGLPFGCGL